MFNIFKKRNSVLKSEPMAFIFIGRSGGGKGTQVELFKNELSKKDGKKILHVESGSLLREFMKGNSYTQIRLKKIIDSGGLVPESIIISLWSQYLKDNFTGNENILFDGTPRKFREAVVLDDALKFYDFEKYYIININVSREWATKRLLARQRKDDMKAAIDKRMDWFDTEVMQSINYFRNNECCHFIEVNGEQTIDEVHNEIMSKVFDIRK